MPSRVELPLDRTYRLVTRSDFDGLVCAALLKELGIIDDILFVHPKGGAVDRADAAKLSMDDILNPQGWILLSYLMDPRTGLGRFREFRISNYQLMMQLIDCCLTMSIEDILEPPDVAERVALYREHADAAAAQIRRASTVHDQVVVLTAACASRTPCSPSGARSSTAPHRSTSAR